MAAASQPGTGLAEGWAPVPKLSGRLQVADIGLVINANDPYSVQVGEHYVQRRGLLPWQVLRVTLPVQPALTATTFENLKRQIDEHFGDRVQALALAWRQPYAVQCAALTGALAMGFDAGFCTRTCDASRENPYANSASSRPFTDHGMRLSMQLAAADEAAAMALIDRGVASDGSLAGREVASTQARFVMTNDRARNVRAALYPPQGWLWRHNIEVLSAPSDRLPPALRVVLLQTGAAQVQPALPVPFVSGALADHLTSFGGRLDGKHSQGTVLEWISAGATASHGSVSEPCNHLQKFPHPQWLLQHYAQGATAIEAYWKSVRWPLQSLFVGEPLAAPFARGEGPGRKAP
jgi:uncharacterized protein (TIGR03790 family)